MKTTRLSSLTNALLVSALCLLPAAVLNLIGTAALVVWLG